ncbi:putative membrane protein [Methanococcus voltae]|uniref:Putative membrane protein n=1 Tax=Methanococcus voltae TaxID=2188 RepID=A0A8J7RGY4_METVO|nr:MarR family transcriptional regulator [Methanococcus voltae]MBP2201667.1 putative membrane protein [Methanococcus voltae]
MIKKKSFEDNFDGKINKKEKRNLKNCTYHNRGLIFKVIILTALVAFCTVSSVEGLKIQNYDVSCKINTSNIVNETIILKIYNNESEDISQVNFDIPQIFSNPSLKSEHGVKSYGLSTMEGVTSLTMDFEKPLKPGATTTLSIGFVRDIDIDYEGKKFVTVTVPAYDSRFTMEIALPQGASIVSPAEGILSISPRDYSIETDGKRIYIKWSKDLDADEKFFTSSVNYAILTPVNPPIDTIHDNTDYLNVYTISLSAVIVLLLIIVLYLIYRLKIILKKSIEDEELDEEKRDEINDLRRNLEISEVNLKNCNKEIDKLEKINSKQNLELKELHDDLEFYKIKNVECNNTITNLESKLKFEKEMNEKLSDAISERDKEIKELEEYQEACEKQKKTIYELNKELTSKKEHIDTLEVKIDKYSVGKAETLLNILTSEEKEIIIIIKEHGTISQKEIVDITGYTKSKISRMISDLEQRGIVEKIKVGRLNKIKLSKNFEDKGDMS